MGFKDALNTLLNQEQQQQPVEPELIAVAENMEEEVQWDLSSMTLAELCSFSTLMFVVKVQHLLLFCVVCCYLVK